MKKLIFIVFVTLLTIGCDNRTEKEIETKIDTIPLEIEHNMTREDTINAMALAFARKESRFNEDAVSKCGRYVGCLQLSKIMVREANRIIGFECFFNEDRYDRQGCYAIFKIVQEHHNPGLDIDKAITMWNPKCGYGYRESVKKYFEYNLRNYSDIENYFEL